MTNPNARRPIGTLEQLRRVHGAEALKSQFGEALKNQEGTAVRMLNDAGLRFATLFVLKPEIENAGLLEKLSARNRAALEICGKIMEDPKSIAAGGISYRDEAVHSAFLWIFRTGAGDDGLSEEYDEVLDLCASVLLRRYREKSILPELADLIFRRNRKHGYLHDLIWAFFEARDPNALRYLAGYLRSPNERDAELACLLLHLPHTGANSREKQTQYREYLRWLRENGAYLYFTGESLQSSNEPRICGVDLGAKYLCKNISPRSRKPLNPLTQQEEESLSCFAQAKEPERAVLSDYSQKLHSRDPAFWNRWIRSPVNEQIRIAKGSGRGRLV